MRRTTPCLAIALTSVIAHPAAAKSLSILLPAICFPDPAPAPATKGCAGDNAKPVCALKE